MLDKNYITSGRNTIIHKSRKFDLLIVNANNPVIIISHRGIGIYKGEVPSKRAIAKKAYQEVVNIATMEVFGEEKTLLFIQALDGREYKIDYSKKDTKRFIKIHQESYL